jgi:hypothetical protein
MCLTKIEARKLLELLEVTRYEVTRCVELAKVPEGVDELWSGVGQPMFIIFEEGLVKGLGQRPSLKTSVTGKAICRARPASWTGEHVACRCNAGAGWGATLQEGKVKERVEVYGLTWWVNI